MWTLHFHFCNIFFEWGRGWEYSPGAPIGSTQFLLIKQTNKQTNQSKAKQNAVSLERHRQYFPEIGNFEIGLKQYRAFQNRTNEELNSVLSTNKLVVRAIINRSNRTEIHHANTVASVFIMWRHRVIEIFKLWLNGRFCFNWNDLLRTI